MSKGSLLKRDKRKLKSVLTDIDKIFLEDLLVIYNIFPSQDINKRIPRHVILKFFGQRHWEKEVVNSLLRKLSTSGYVVLSDYFVIVNTKKAKV